MQKNKRSCIVVFSGGQDSTICLHWAMNNFTSVKAVFFEYGQRHAVEKQAAEKIAEMNGIHLKTFQIPFFKDLGGNALIDDSLEITQHPDKLPNTFVPGRNLIFLTHAASYAYVLGIQDLVTGVCQTDYSGYPDCRENTMKALEQSLSLGLDKAISIHTPLMHLNKAESVRLGVKLGALESLAFSHTCYEGLFPPCQACPACRLREKGFLEAGIPDPLLQRIHK